MASSGNCAPSGTHQGCREEPHQGKTDTKGAGIRWSHLWRLQANQVLPITVRTSPKWCFPGANKHHQEGLRGLYTCSPPFVLFF